MKHDRTATTNGQPASASDGLRARAELEGMQAQCRQQAVVIDALSEAVSTFRRGANALKAEDAELRAEIAGLHDGPGSPAGAAGPWADGEHVEVVVALDARAPGAARDLVARSLERRVAASALECGQLLASELVTNSLQHTATAAGEVIVSIELMPDCFRVGVQDSGSDAVIAARPPNLDTGGGFGLNLVQMLSERWGVERLAGGGTQVWAQLPRTPRVGTDSSRNGSGRPAIGPV